MCLMFILWFTVSRFDAIVFLFHPELESNYINFCLITEGNIFTWGWGGSHGTFSEEEHSSGGQLVCFRLSYILFSCLIIIVIMYIRFGWNKSLKCYECTFSWVLINSGNVTCLGEHGTRTRKKYTLLLKNWSLWGPIYSVFKIFLVLFWVHLVHVLLQILSALDWKNRYEIESI